MIAKGIVATVLLSIAAGPVASAAPLPLSTLASLATTPWTKGVQLAQRETYGQCKARIIQECRAAYPGYGVGSPEVQGCFADREYECENIPY